MTGRPQNLQYLFENLMQKFESSRERDLLTSHLEKLCQTLDPFNPLNQNQIKAIEILGIEKDINPYQLTNTLVFLLEECILDKQKRSEHIL